MSIPLDQVAGMPAFSPYFPALPARYRNASFQFVYFRAEVAAVDRFLPSCFEPAEDGFCAAIGLTVPWSANYGSFQESLIVLKCVYEGRIGYFAPVVFLNSRSSISAGREIYGTPKVAADVSVDFDERVMFTRTTLAEASVFSIRSSLHMAASVDDIPSLLPSWRLKVIPRADGNGHDVMQLIDTSSTTTDVNVHECRSGDGVVQFDPSPVYDLTGLAPLEYMGAHYLEMDYTEGYAEIEHDFLEE